MKNIDLEKIGTVLYVTNGQKNRIYRIAIDPHWTLLTDLFNI